MFTGIIEKVARIAGIATDKDRSRVVVDTGYPDLELGESVAVNGVCLTVAELFDAQGKALFFVSSESLSRTNLGMLRAGSRVNLERALLSSTRLSGHLVQGHVDGLATLSKVESASDCRWLELDLPENLARYCVEKGSIALNGVSLTINRIENGGRVFITLIPHTWANTSFSEYAPGDSINVEVDVLAKYVEKLCQPYLKR